MSVVPSPSMQLWWWDSREWVRGRRCSLEFQAYIATPSSPLEWEGKTERSTKERKVCKEEGATLCACNPQYNGMKLSLPADCIKVKELPYCSGMCNLSVFITGQFENKCSAGYAWLRANAYLFVSLLTAVLEFGGGLCAHELKRRLVKCKWKVRK